MARRTTRKFITLHQAAQQVSEEAQRKLDDEILAEESRAQWAFLDIKEAMGSDHPLTNAARAKYVKLCDDAHPAFVRRSQRMMQEQLDAGAEVRD